MRWSYDSLNITWDILGESLYPFDSFPQMVGFEILISFSTIWVWHNQVSWSCFTQPGLARLSHGIYVLSVCVSACLVVCPHSPDAWTFRYLLYTLDLKVPFEYLEPFLYLFYT